MLPVKIESLLLVSNRTLSVKELASLCKSDEEEVQRAISLIMEKFNKEDSGIRVVRAGDKFQFATSPDSSEVVSEFIKHETVGDLTRPQLETLTIIAYRCPITKDEIEQIRGVNCTVVIRNLMTRGLIEAEGEMTQLLTRYVITTDFLRHLGLSDVKDLPEYDNLRNDERILDIITG